MSDLLPDGGVSITGGTVSGQIVSHSTGTFTQNNGVPTHPGERLCILYLTATSSGNLRVDEEARRVIATVRAATHRDRVRIEHLPAATTSDLLDGLTRVTPNVVHFAGHAGESAVVFDSGGDRHGPGQHLTTENFALALRSVDAPPTLVVLNACRSAAQLTGLLGSVPLAIGMSGSILDVAAMTFAARFYRSVADGQSVGAAFRLAKAEMSFAGRQADLPMLAHSPTTDPNLVKLVTGA